MPQVGPYLTFNGNCAEAMNFYKEVFGGELRLMKFGDAPMDTPGDSKDRIMHAHLSNGEFNLLASDGMPGQAPIEGNNVTLNVNCDSKEQQDQYFSKLAEGGKITM